MSKDYLEAARTIRSYLPELLDYEQAKSIDTQLADLLNQSESDVDSQIADILYSTEITRQWTEQFLGLETLTKLKAGYQPIAGNPTQPVSGMIKYVCPHGDFVYYQSREGETIPLCPTHNCALNKV